MQNSNVIGSYKTIFRRRGGNGIFLVTFPYKDRILKTNSIRGTEYTLVSLYRNNRNIYKYIICAYLVNFIEVVSNYFNWLFLWKIFTTKFFNNDQIRVKYIHIFTNIRFLCFGIFPNISRNLNFRLVLPCYIMLQQFRILRTTSKKVERVRKQRGTKCFKAPTRFYKFFKTYHRGLHRLM